MPFLRRGVNISYVDTFHGWYSISLIRAVRWMWGFGREPHKRPAGGASSVLAIALAYACRPKAAHAVFLGDFMKKCALFVAAALVLLAVSCSGPFGAVSDDLALPKEEVYRDPVRAISLTSPDAYENDDTRTYAKTITTNAAAQEHNFYDDANDYMKLAAVAGTQYTIETWVLGYGDTYLYVYDNYTVKASNDDKASGDYGSKIVWTAPSTKTYYIRSYSYGGRTGSNRGYNISVTSGGGGGGTITLPQPSKAWTVLVYLDGDNNLSTYATKDIAEMYGVGSDATNLNIVVLWDNASTTHGYYYIEAGKATLLKDVGEVNMGATATANAFIDWATANFPAQKFAWIWWNHGGAVDRPVYRGVCWDDTNSGDHLSEVEQLSIMTYLKGKIGKNVEAVGFDACLMATAEVYYQYRNVANYMAASEQTEPGDGWNYAFLSSIKSSPTSTGAYFTQRIRETYAAWYSSYSDVTFCNVDITKAAALGTAIDAFADAAMASGISGSTFKSLMTSLPSFSGYTKDLYAYMTNIYNSSSMTSTVKTAAANVRTAISNMVLGNWTGSTWTGKAYGASITMMADTTTYSQLDLCVNTSWDEFCTFAGF